MAVALAAVNYVCIGINYILYHLISIFDYNPVILCNMYLLANSDLTHVISC